MNLISTALNDKLLKHFAIVGAIYIPLSFVIAIITRSFLNIMLGWNIILAFIPIILAYLFQLIIKEEKTELSHKIKIVLIFLFWLFFFPNSFYIITDFIHLGGEEFYFREHLYAPFTYTKNFIGYLTLLHIFFGAFVAAVMASYSLKMMQEYLINKYSRIKSELFVIVILFLSSIGIYIGRFLRLNSWDMLNPFYVIERFFISLNTFSIEFILMFLLIQAALYYFIRPFIKINITL